MSYKFRGIFPNKGTKKQDLLQLTVFFPLIIDFNENRQKFLFIKVQKACNSIRNEGLGTYQHPVDI